MSGAGGRLTVYTDGTSKGNPGEAGIGVVIYDARGRVVKELSEPIGRATNNVAEYRAFIRGLEEAVALRPQEVTLVADAELIVEQVRGGYNVRDEELRPLHERARQLLAMLPQAKIVHVPREENWRADRLANKAISRA